MKTITVNGAQLTIQSLYPYRYDYGEGKEVLRIDISRDDHGYAQIEVVLEHPAGDIVYAEDGEAVNVYKGYILDFKCNYANRVYSVEITRVTETELKIENLEARINALESELAAEPDPVKNE